MDGVDLSAPRNAIKECPNKLSCYNPVVLTNLVI